MKLFALSFLIISITQTSFARDPNYGKCSFKCEEIPLESEVLRSAGVSELVQLPSKRISVLSWNLYKGRNKEFVKSFDRLSKDRDIILLSEATEEAPVSTSMLKQPGMGWHLAAAFEMKKKVGTGTAVGSIAHAKDVRFYRTKDVEPFVKSPKATILAEYAIPGSKETLLALSIHGINWSGNDALERQLNMILPDLQNHKGPIVFAGDFNFKNPERLQLAKEILAKAGLERVPWENPIKKKQLDDAFTRGVKVHKALLIHDKGSDHPAIDLDIEVL